MPSALRVVFRHRNCLFFIKEDKPPFNNDNQGFQANPQNFNPRDDYKVRDPHYAGLTQIIIPTSKEDSVMILGKPTTIKPLYNIFIHKEDGRLLDNDGETVIANDYWLRRLGNGDVEEVIPVQAQPLDYKIPNRVLH